MSSPVDERPVIAAVFDRWNRRLPTVGMLTVAALFWAAVTGVVLAIGYDVHDAMSSLARLELGEVTGRLMRSWHAWAGHLLVIATVLHTVEHVSRRSDRRLRFGVWVRTVSSLLLVLGVMLTGFMLRGDVEGALARQIVEGLLVRIPLAGEALAAALVGTGDDLQIVYVHHAATATLLIYLFAVEHGRRLWPTAIALGSVVAVALVMAWVFPPNLHAGIDPVVKGPWYFLAIQEALHWLTRPSWVWLGLVGVVAALLALPSLSARARANASRVLALVLSVYVIASLFAAIFRGAGWELRWPGSPGPSSRASTALVEPMALGSIAVNEIDGRPEGCVACHAAVTGLSSSHDPSALGCASCHLGDPFAPDAHGAHQGMVLVPGNLDVAAHTCGDGRCHEAIVGRVRGSLMATVRGMIAVDRWAFGEQPTPDGTDGVAELTDSPADTHLRQLCISCHLGHLKNEPGPVTESSRGGGCVICHLSEPDERTYARDNARAFAHPSLTVSVRDESCFGCHSRSGRISLHYQGWTETHRPLDELPADRRRQLADGRVLERHEPDAHQRAGMACIDCHTAAETMGDGHAHLHEEQATRVRCETCHRVSPPETVALDALPPEGRAVVRLRYGEKAPSRYLREDRTDEPLTNAWPASEGEVTVVVRGKLDGTDRLARPPAWACSEIEGHARLSCRACHTTWVMQCVACHTQFDADGRRSDLPTRDERGGAWVEFDGPVEIAAPALGVFERDGGERIEPFAPGMIMTVNGPDVDVPSPLPDRASKLMRPETHFVRAFALAVPHTTTRAGRSCGSCHTDPRALGYGAGTLRWNEDASRWHFEAAYAPRTEDDLPQDAWIPFLAEPDGALATRTQARPLGLAAQQRTLRVGACLECHDPGTDAGRAFYLRWPGASAARGPGCRGPAAP